MKKLYIRGSKLGRGTGEPELRQAFEKFGELWNIYIAKNDAGFGFVEFTHEKDAAAALEALSNQEVNGEKLVIEFAKEKVKADVKPGDWECQRCHVNNFARREECFKCHSRKPHGIQRYRDRSRDRSGYGRERSRERPRYGRERSRSRDRERSRERPRYARERSMSRDRERSRERPRYARERSMSRDRERSRERPRYGRERSMSRDRERSRERPRYARERSTSRERRSGPRASRSRSRQRASYNARRSRSNSR